MPRGPDSPAPGQSSRFPPKPQATRAYPGPAWQARTGWPPAKIQNVNRNHPTVQGTIKKSPVLPGNSRKPQTQERHNQNKKEEPADAQTEAEMLGLSDRDFKSVVLEKLP